MGGEEKEYILEDLFSVRILRHRFFLLGGEEVGDWFWNLGYIGMCVYWGGGGGMEPHIRHLCLFACVCGPMYAACQS